MREAAKRVWSAVGAVLESRLQEVASGSSLLFRRLLQSIKFVFDQDFPAQIMALRPTAFSSRSDLLPTVFDLGHRRIQRVMVTVLLAAFTRSDASALGVRLGGKTQRHPAVRRDFSLGQDGDPVLLVRALAEDASQVLRHFLSIPKSLSNNMSSATGTGSAFGFDHSKDRNVLQGRNGLPSPGAKADHLSRPRSLRGDGQERASRYSQNDMTSGSASPLVGANRPK